MSQEHPASVSQEQPASVSQEHPDEPALPAESGRSARPGRPGPPAGVGGPERLGPPAGPGGPRSTDGLDCIELRGLRCVATHGVLPEERERAQPFEVDVWVWANLSVPGASDNLADTIDYGGLAEVVMGAMNRGHASLLEHLAERVAGAVLCFGGPAVTAPRAVTVTVRKLRPPLPLDLASSAVTVTRHATR